MKFIKLHQGGREILVNMSTVTDIYTQSGNRKSILYLNFEVGGVQVHFNVDESLDEIFKKVKESE